METVYGIAVFDNHTIGHGMSANRWIMTSVDRCSGPFHPVFIRFSDAEAYIDSLTHNSNLKIVEIEIRLPNETQPS